MVELNIPIGVLSCKTKNAVVTSEQTMKKYDCVALNTIERTIEREEIGPAALVFTRLFEV